PGTLQELISQTMVHWAQESFIQSPALVRAMFSLLHRQYDALGELGRALPKAYAISATSVPDTTALLECLGQIRSLLIVQMGPEEENLMIQSIGSPCVLPGSPWVTLGHPVSSLGHPGSPCVLFGSPCVLPGSPCVLSGSARVTLCPPGSSLGHPVSSWVLSGSPWVTLCPLWVTLCPPWVTLCPPWVTLGHPGSPCVLFGSPWVTLCPLWVTLCPPWVTLCPLWSCPMLLAKGYPDIGWNPCGGEKYLDFLRFAVFVNGETPQVSPGV
ncbi:RYR1 protein, partial [Loxia leucoptera]|nr:RYR1 protein [Loxia leucoptera]